MTSETPEPDSASTLDGRPRYFYGRPIDDSPAFLEQSYSLRYQVYCLERGFLPAESYPDHLERDMFDAQSIHFGTINLQGELVGTARLVQSGDAGFPIFGHCTTFGGETEIYQLGPTVVEVSRLSVSRNYRRRKDDGAFGVRGAAPFNVATDRREGPARLGGELVVSLYKALYQASKRHGFTHWLAATEKSLFRLLLKYEFPLRAIGPESDYFGPVSPYLMSLEEFDQVIVSHRNPYLDDFLLGLEPEFRPQPLE